MEPEPKNFEWWSRSLKLEFPFNRHILCSKPFVQNAAVLIFNGPSRSEAGAKSFGCLEPEPEILSFGSTDLVPAIANLAPGFYLQVFRSMLQVGQLKSNGVSTGLVNVKTIVVFITHVQYLVETCSGTHFVGNFSSNVSLTFLKTSGKRSLHFIQIFDHP